MMEQKETRISQTMTALLLAAAILLGTILIAEQAKNSNLYQRGRIYGSIVTQNSVGIGELLREPEHIRMLARFVGAVTSAYINFELIPVNEAGTFAAVYSSLNDSIAISQFEYQRRNLIIDGDAETVEGYEQFAEALRLQNHFDSVSGDYYISTDDRVRFKMICVAATAQSLVQGPEHK